MLARRKPTKTFPYGLGRVDLAGIIIVLIILVSAMWRAVRPSIACSTRRQLATSAG
jgi:divalent metal cation (Fe/Co/Zn/Cd) transporter